MSKLLQCIAMMAILQTYDDYLEDVLSLDMAQEAVADRNLISMSDSWQRP